MVVQEASDLHWEFQADHGLGQATELAKTQADVLILAGDIIPAKYVNDYLAGFERLAARYGRIVYVPGNHEFYGTNFEDGINKLKTLEVQFPNITILDRKVVEIGDAKFAGTTLWFPFQDGNNRYKQYMSDFKLIHERVEAFYKENTYSVEWLRNNTDVDVVITHHVPMEMCVTRKWFGHYLNRFFVGKAEHALYHSNASHIVWGHTHESTDERFSERTRFICNPFGYARKEENSSFNHALTFEV